MIDNFSTAGYGPLATSFLSTLLTELFLHCHRCIWCSMLLLQRLLVFPLHLCIYLWNFYTRFTHADTPIYRHCFLSLFLAAKYVLLKYVLTIRINFGTNFEHFLSSVVNSDIMILKINTPYQTQISENSCIFDTPVDIISI